MNLPIINTSGSASSVDPSSPVDGVEVGCGCSYGCDWCIR